MFADIYTIEKLLEFKEADIRERAALAHLGEALELSPRHRAYSAARGLFAKLHIRRRRSEKTDSEHENSEPLPSFQ